MGDDVTIANNNGVKIYYDVIGKGPPLLLHHAFATDHTGWSNPDENWVAALKEDFTLILMDARGHGESDKFHKPEDYLAIKQASDVIAILDDLHLKKAHFLGYSMGGGVGFGLACYFQERFYSFVLGGSSAEDDTSTEPNPILPFFRQGAQATIEMIEGMSNRPISERWKNILQKSDFEALSACLESKEKLCMETLLPSVKVPTMIYVGDKDFAYEGAKRASELIPNGVFLPLQGDHMTPYLEQAIPHIKKFLKELG